MEDTNSSTVRISFSITTIPTTVERQAKMRTYATYDMYIKSKSLQRDASNMRRPHMTNIDIHLTIKSMFRHLITLDNLLLTLCSES